MIYEKKYIQFNDFVFGTYDLVSGDDEPIQYKGSSTAYSYTHGSYRPMKNSYLYVSEKQVNMTITLNTEKLPCEQRTDYVRYFEQELGKLGRLWAIKNNELIWAFAVANNVRPVKNHRKYKVTYDIEFLIPGGVWHKADKLKTFLVPYNACTFMDCKGFEKHDDCPSVKGSGDCCSDCIDKKMREGQRERCDCCEEGMLLENMALCYHKNELQEFYGCEPPYQVVYDCEQAELFSKEKAFGTKLCVDSACDDSIISGRFYSETDIPTEEMTITIIGDMKNPWVTINGNTNVINGEYGGRLIIHGNGDVYYQKDECCEPQILPPSVWSIPGNMDYGWTIHPRMNSITVHLNKCCAKNGLACVYIDHDAITT